MGSLIQELENNEALLLMYLTDELPVVDRAEVEQMLANDAGLRANLAQLASAYNGAMGALATLDQDRSAEPAENHAVRQASRAMKQWQVDRLSRQPMVLPTPRTRVPVWAYPIGVAAMLLIAALTWWGGQSDPTMTLAPSRVSGVTPPVGSGPLASGPTSPVMATSDDAAKTRLLENSFNEVPAEITDAERQAKSLIARSDNSSVPSLDFMAEANP